MKAVTIVIDSFGVGYFPDARLYGDARANTALHICEAIEDVRLPDLMRLGLGNSSEFLGNTLPGIPAKGLPLSNYGVMKEKSPGKDTTTGRWELAGIILENSFPDEIIVPFCWEISSGILGNESPWGQRL